MIPLKRFFQKPPLFCPAPPIVFWGGKIPGKTLSGPAQAGPAHRTPQRGGARGGKIFPRAPTALGPGGQKGGEFKKGAVSGVSPGRVFPPGDPGFGGEPPYPKNPWLFPKRENPQKKGAPQGPPGAMRPPGFWRARGDGTPPKGPPPPYPFR